MKNIEFERIWKTYDQKIEQVLTINKDIAIQLSKQQLDQQISRLNAPKWTAILIGVPYTIILAAIAIIAFIADAYFIALGFSVISLIMTTLIISYCYQLYLISEIRSSGDLLATQRQLAKLRISSVNCLNYAVFQLPFWSICWISVETLKDSPLLYGGVNLIVFLLLAYASYWLFQRLSPTHPSSKVRDFLLSGRAWEPIKKSEEILVQIQEYEE